MFERILVGIDNSPQATRVLGTVSELASKLGATVVVVHVRDVSLPVTMAATAGRPGAMPRGGTVEDEQAAHELVQSAVQTLADAGVQASGQVGSGWGATAKELLRLAEEHRAELIVVGSHGSAVAQILLGSVAYRVVHQAACPVLVVR